MLTEFAYHRAELLKHELIQQQLKTILEFL